MNSSGMEQPVPSVTVPDVAENRICSDSLDVVVSPNPQSLDVSVLAGQVYSCL